MKNPHRKWSHASVFILFGLFLFAVVIGLSLLLNDSTDACGRNDIGGGPSKCFGAIALMDVWDVEYDYFYDSVNDYEIAGIFSDDRYVATDTKIYVINQMPNVVTATALDGSRTYYLKIFQDGAIKIF